jgi:hypothetical protein
MNVKEFKASLTGDTIPTGLSAPLQALWMEARGDWDQAHNTVQNATGTDAAWVHAYLHRKEGDISNAAYWYAHAGRKRSTLSLKEEWEEIAGELLAGSNQR